ncbi:MAG TPA: GH1 family beta-glucosidase [Galbitalea sp.]|jgi:beta-glucosidase
MRRSDFPQDFVWGTATAAYQIEGAVAEDGRGASIWDTFSRRPGAIADATTGDIAVDHYHRYLDDIRLMSDLGVDAYRFSIAWPRIQPSGRGAANQAGLDFYRRLADALHEAGITPWATLYHWDLPQELEDAGGWMNGDTADRFADYAAASVQALGDVIPNWITLNEPWCSAFLGYASGDHAPGRQLGTESARAAHNLLLGHGRGLAAIRAARPEVRAGITLNLYSVVPATDDPADIDAARRIDGLSNRLFLEPVLSGEYPADVVRDLGQGDWFAENVTEEDLAQISAPIDFLGINYYSRHTTSAGESAASASASPGSEFVRMIDTGAKKTQMGWEIHPDGLIDVLQMANRLAPELPLYITENGSAYEDTPGPDGTVDDPERLAYLQGHLEASRQAIAHGLPLHGYFAWSLMDNFEWAWGQSRRFGLHYVDYATQHRTPKSSARWMSRLLAGE